MCCKGQDQGVRGGGENSFWLRCHKVTCGEILSTWGVYRKVDEMTFAVLIKHQMVTVLGKA